MYCDSINDPLKYKKVKRDGIVAILVNKRKVLLLKRRSFVLMLNPGIWSFLSGGRKASEKYMDTAYREIKEETGIEKAQLVLLHHSKAHIFEKNKKQRWSNEFYIFRSGTDKVRLDLENSRYRWAAGKDVENEVAYTNVFINEKEILRHIKAHIDG